MIRPLNRLDDDDPRRRKVAKDGETVRVSMFMMDGLDPVQRAVASATLADNIPILHRPGFVRLSAADAEARQGMYDAADKRLTEQWRGQPLKKPAPTLDQASPSLTTDARATAYSAYENRVTNAWRHP